METSTAPSKRLPADIYSRKCTVLKVDGATPTFGVLVMGHDKPKIYMGVAIAIYPETGGIIDPILTNKEEVETSGFPSPPAFRGVCDRPSKRLNP